MIKNRIIHPILHRLQSLAQYWSAEVAKCCITGWSMFEIGDLEWPWTV